MMSVIDIWISVLIKSQTTEKYSIECYLRTIPSHLIGLLWSREVSLCEKPECEGQKLLGTLFGSLCRHCRWLTQTNCDGRFLTFITILNALSIPPNLGFQSLTEELSQLSIHVHGDVDGRKERLYHLQNVVSNSIEMKEEKLSSMQKQYDRYKETYAKFLRFSPDDEPTSFSRLLFSHIEIHFSFSCHSRACSTGGSVHFL